MSLKSKSSFRSLCNRIIPSCFRRDLVYALGILGTTEVRHGDDDIWMATDFVALRHLLGTLDDLSQWFCATSIRDDKYLIGDPACDRFVFDPPPFETVLPSAPILFSSYLREVRAVSLKLRPQDTLILVLVGHGSNQNGSFLVGDSHKSWEISKETLEFHLAGTKGRIVLISTASYSGGWESPHWTLPAAAGANQEAPSIVISGSEQHRRCFFMNALFAEFADEDNIKSPRPGLVNDNGHRGCQPQRDFGPEKSVIALPRVPQRSTQDIFDWIHQFRDSIGSSLHSATSCVMPLPTPACQHSAIQRPANLSMSEEAELMELATQLLCFMPVSTANEIPMIRRCLTIVHGPRNGRRPLDSSEKSKVLSQLRTRAHYRELSSAIAKNLGWEKAVEQLGGPSGNRMRLCNDYGLQKQAEANGCHVGLLLIHESPIHLWGSAASWLARVWDASGRLVVPPEDWESAVKRSRPELR
ncbi:hypothetical protein D9615_008566 [Tricholomella constricta]|uniref:Uncharacterized protein n=1 Tax=Tricholomella constricta TaxID=117010 RepID=A0A8H5M0E7_9AGAR|nr:hypothetical protein D9615_008566 [Tricholomella constricta]